MPDPFAVGGAQATADPVAVDPFAPTKKRKPPANDPFARPKIDHGGTLANWGAGTGPEDFKQSAVKAAGIGMQAFEHAKELGTGASNVVVAGDRASQGVLQGALHGEDPFAITKRVGKAVMSPDDINTQSDEVARGFADMLAAEGLTPFSSVARPEDENAPSSFVSHLHDVFNSIDNPQLRKAVASKLADLGAHTPGLAGPILLAQAKILGSYEKIPQVADNLISDPRARNMVRYGVVQAATEPSTYIPGLDVVTLGSRAIKVAHDIAALNPTFKAASEATRFQAARAFTGRGIYDWMLAPGAKAKVPQAHLAAESAHSDIAEHINATLGELKPHIESEEARVAAAKKINAMQLPWDPHRPPEIIQAYKKTYGLRAVNEEVLPTGQAVWKLNENYDLDPRYRDLMDMDSWLNGTQKVRDAIVEQAKQQRRSLFSTLPAAQRQVLDNAPLLNIQTKYRNDYIPQHTVSELDADAPSAMNAIRQQGFNLPQRTESDSPLFDRIESRLAMGHAARDGMFQRASMVKHGLGIDMPRPSTAMIDYALAHMDNPLDRPALEEERLSILADQARYDDVVKNALSEFGKRQRMVTTSKDPVTQHVPFQTPGFADHQAADLEAARMVNKLGIDPEHIAGMSRAIASDEGNLTLPYLLAEKMFKANPPHESSVLEKISDVARHALFIIPWTHQKNIATLQLQGPGGGKAFAYGLHDYKEMGHPDQAAAMAALHGAYDILSGDPRFRSGLEVLKKTEQPNLFRWQHQPGEPTFNEGRQATFFSHTPDEGGAGGDYTGLGSPLGGHYQVKRIDQAQNRLHMDHRVADASWDYLEEYHPIIRQELDEIKRLHYHGAPDERDAASEKLLRQHGFSPDEIKTTIAEAERISTAKEASTGAANSEFAWTIQDAVASRLAQREGHDAFSNEREYVALKPGVTRPPNYESIEDMHDTLKRMGAAWHYIGKPFNSIEEAANKVLFDFELAQRFGLHKALMETKDYQDLSELERGAIINKVLFDYYHQSPVATWLRKAGAPFPHWRIGSMGRELHQAVEDPRRMIKMARTEQLLKSVYFPNRNDDQSAYPDMNTPLDEASTGLLNPISWMQTTAGPAGAATRMVPFNWHDLGSGAGEAAQQLGRSYVPGFGIGLEGASGIGDRLSKSSDPSLADKGQQISDIATNLGANPFHSKGDRLFEALLNLVGGHFSNYPSSYKQLEDELRTEDPSLSKFKAGCGNAPHTSPPLMEGIVSVPDLHDHETRITVLESSMGEAKAAIEKGIERLTTRVDALGHTFIFSILGAVVLAAFIVWFFHAVGLLR